MEKIIPSRTTIPFLKGVKLETTDDSLILTTSNLDMSLKAFCPAKVLKKGDYFTGEIL